MSSHLLQCNFQTLNICLRLYHAIFYLGLDFIFFFFSKTLLLSIFFHPSTIYFNHKQTALTSNLINMASKHKLYQSWFVIWILFAYGQEIFWNL